MNEIKPTVGCEFSDNYIEAINKLGEFKKAFDNLTDNEKIMFANSTISAAGMSMVAEQFIKFINNGGSL